LEGDDLNQNPIKIKTDHSQSAAHAYRSALRLKPWSDQRTVLTGLKRSAKVFFSQAESFNGCDKKRLRA
jgi:cytochrome c-type biogenesis protein CcmH/NrfG